MKHDEKCELNREHWLGPKMNMNNASCQCASRAYAKDPFPEPAKSDLERLG